MISRKCPSTRNGFVEYDVSKSDGSRTEGFAFFAWHRLMWPGRTEHTNGMFVPSCQTNYRGDWICRVIWADPRGI